MDCSRLHLLSPLFYREIAAAPPGQDSSLQGTDPFAGEFFGLPDNSSGLEPFPEMLFHFRINPSRAFVIDAGGEDYLGPLIAAGKAVEPNGAKDGLELPAGEYFFTQIREKSDKETFVEMALELQKEGLWERLPLGETVYFRTLWEDGAPVSQVLRPIAHRSDGNVHAAA
jgi:hypothetical protein